MGNSLWFMTDLLAICLTIQLLNVITSQRSWSVANTSENWHGNVDLTDARLDELTETDV